jgi:hypothetical protein
MALHKLPIGIQSFEKLRSNGYLYVDKTDLVYKLVSYDYYYFLSRPRRFGKSLLLSTIEAYFKGQKELFEGLAISQLEHDWIEYPVFHLDLNSQHYDSIDDLNRMLNSSMVEWGAQYGVALKGDSPSICFGNLIRDIKRATGKSVVLLIDEYDQPILQNISKDALQEDMRNKLRAFYSVIKSEDSSIRFAIFTGVTRFGRLSIFSGLNNLLDISMHNDYSSICGITDAEIDSYFAEDLQALADSEGISYEEAREKCRENYDGYKFSEKSPLLYNPYSLLNALYYKKIGSYWLSSGTPSFLMNMLKKNQFNISNIENEISSEKELTDIETILTEPIPVLYQTGYLTIKGYDEVFDSYVLGFPNKEVEVGFFKLLMKSYSSSADIEGSFDVKCFVQDINSGDVEQFMQRLKAFIADVPYDNKLDTEANFQNLIYVLFRLMGLYVKVEQHTSFGRLDMVVTTARHIYIFEFKVNSTAEAALKQIDEKHYADPYTADGRPIVKLGINFDTARRNIDSWVVE